MLGADQGGSLMAKLRVGLLFGGRSVEHEVSIASATSIARALDPSRYEVLPIWVGQDRRWRIGAPGMLPAAAARAGAPDLPALSSNRAIERVGGDAEERRVDVIFPIIHGTNGEDGSLQGFLELAGLPYVGAGVLGSAVGMDKDVTKRLLVQAGVPVVPWLLVRAAELEQPEALAGRVFQSFAPPVFVKPACLGSSVGTAKVHAREELLPALREAARYDEKLLVERAVDAREIEVAVLGDQHPEASVPGEIRPKREFYDYEAKYVDEDTELLVPAPLDEAQTALVRRLALEAYRAVEGAGMARVDFFLERPTGDFYVNELNTLPGFTDVSMYPRLWEASGLPYPALLDRLIELALERHRRRGGLETTYRRG
jgi:D-alanine-D-alanine ligase